MRVFVFALAASLAAACATTGQTPSAARSTVPQAVLGTTWQWEVTATPVGKVTVPNPENYTIRLMEAGRVEARFDCNRGGGAYEISAGTLAFGPLMSTRRACPPESLDGPFMRDLGRVNSFFIEEGKLFLELPLDSGTMRFRPAP